MNLLSLSTYSTFELLMFYDDWSIIDIETSHMNLCDTYEMEHDFKKTLYEYEHCMPFKENWALVSRRLNILI
jgi:hypothetical protein